MAKSSPEKRLHVHLYLFAIQHDLLERLLELPLGLVEVALLAREHGAERVVLRGVHELPELLQLRVAPRAALPQRRAFESQKKLSRRSEAQNVRTAGFQFHELRDIIELLMVRITNWKMLVDAAEEGAR